MESVEELKQEIELLQKKLELLKLIDELQSKVYAPKIEHVPVYPAYPTYPDTVHPWQTWPPIVTCGDTTTIQTSVIDGNWTPFAHEYGSDGIKTYLRSR